MDLHITFFLSFIQLDYRIEEDMRFATIISRVNCHDADLEPGISIVQDMFLIVQFP
jgi:hypothetical protein